jgi:hypothetical protein
VADDTNNASDVFLHDTCLGAGAGCVPSTVRVSVASDGIQGNDPSFGGSLSADGRFVAFVSFATNLTPNSPAGGYPNIFVRDTCLGAPAGCTPSTVRVTVGINGTGGWGFSPALSADGRFVVFVSDSTNLVAGDTNGRQDAFLADTASTGNDPVVSLSPGSLAFGSQLVGTTSTPLTVNLTNTGSADLAISSIAATGDFAQTNNCGSSVAPGASCTISVRFTPTTSGPRSGTVTITNNADGSPHVVSLTGTGNSPPITSLHIGDLDRTTTKQGNTWTASVTVTVHDSSDNEVLNATVSGSWSIGGTIVGTGSCTRSASVKCTVSKSGISKNTASVTFKVDNVTHSTLTYKAADNHESDGDSNGSSIVVNRP